MKQKVGIVTLVNFEHNFGNRLQNYALQTVVERLGFRVETINDIRCVKHTEAALIQLLRYLAHYITRYKYVPSIHKAGIRFWLWVKKYRKATSYTIKKDEDFYSKVDTDKYAFFITGSDQIWRPVFTASSNFACFLQFAPPHKRIAYAPSFGMKYEDFPEDKKVQYTQWLSSGWRALSVREKSGADAIMKMIHQQVPVVLDPTMLLTANEWQKIANKRRVPKHYLLVYCLRTNKYLPYAKELALRNNLEIVDLNNDDQYSGCNPSDFIYYVSNADCVLTNSFHCNVFSFLFHKQVAYYMSDDEQTQKISSRIDTLLELTGKQIILNRELTIYPEIDWKLYEENLSTRRKNAMKFLYNALKGGTNND